MGLVLIYKSSGVFNFAQGEFGTVALCALYLLHSNDVPYGFAVIGGLLASMLLGFLTERVDHPPALRGAARDRSSSPLPASRCSRSRSSSGSFDNQGRPIAKAFAESRSRHASSTSTSPTNGCG